MLSTFMESMQASGLVNQPSDSSDPTTHPNIQEILRKRREMLNRVRADLDKIGKLQQEFLDEQKRNSAPGEPAPKKAQ
jgi:hypothetical protein